MPIPANGSGFVQIRYRRLLTYIRRLDRLDKYLRNDIDIAPAIRGMSRAWKENYDAEGSDVRPTWKQLSKRTRRVRRQRGYPDSHPILVQSGNLKRAAIDYPMMFAKKSMSRTTPGSGHKWSGGPTTITITTSPNRARMKISGDKVANNFGGKMFGKIALPRRKFWYVSPKVQKYGAIELAKSTQPKLDELEKR